MEGFKGFRGVTTNAFLTTVKRLFYKNFKGSHYFKGVKGFEGFKGFKGFRGYGYSLSILLIIYFLIFKAFKSFEGFKGIVNVEDYKRVVAIAVSRIPNVLRFQVIQIAQE